MKFIKLAPNGVFNGHFNSPAEWAMAEPVKLFNGHFIRPPSHLVLPGPGGEKRVEVRADKEGNLLLSFEGE